MSKLRNPRVWSRIGVLVLVAVMVTGFGISATATAPENVGGAAGSSAYLQQEFKPNVDGNVSLFSGAATYSYPIAVPPGTHGMQPNIALAYNSQGGNGPLGLGWDIAGLPTIERSTKKGAPKYDSTDTFVFGGDDLVLASDGTYHTKNESFTKITNTLGFGAGSYWEAWTKNGTYMRFGLYENSRIQAVGKGGPVRVWALDKVMDTNGNYMIISYSEDTVNGAYYPTDITYTFNDVGGIANYRYVKFFWAARSDVVPNYRQGALVKVNQRLDYIETYIGGTAAANRVNKYQLIYTTGTGGRSLLSSVKVYGTSADTTGLPATTFAYKALAAGFGGVQNWGNPKGGYIRETGSSGASTVLDSLDMNGDGMPDVVYRDSGSGNANYQVWLNTGSGFGGQQLWGNPVGSYLRETSGSQTTLDLMDMNGDGMPDVVYRNGDSGEFNYQVWLNTGSGFGPRQLWGNPTGRYLRETSTNVSISTTLDLIDMNGDGLPDVVSRTGGGAYQVWLNNGSGFATTPTSWGGLPNGPTGITIRETFTTAYGGNTYLDLIDMNGDGLPDAVFRGTGSSSNYWIWLNTGSSFTDKQDWGNPRYPEGGEMRLTLDSGLKNYLDLVDMNGDGRPDVVYRGGTYVGQAPFRVYLNTGSGFTGEVNWGDPGNSNVIRSTLAGYGTVDDLMDINGDGLLDVVSRAGLVGQNNYSAWLNTATGTDLLTTVGLPTGGSISYSYDRASVYSNTRLPFPMWVVTSVTTNDGLGVAARTTYWYSGALYKGYPDNEFRGFRQVAVFRPDGMKSVTFYNQGNVYKGSVDKAYIKDTANSSIYSATINEYDYTEPNTPNSQPKTVESEATAYNPVTHTGGVYLPRLRATKSYLVEGATADEGLPFGTYQLTRKTFDYDAYGNTTVSRDWGIVDPSTQVDVLYDRTDTVTEYVNDTNLHILGAPYFVTVYGYNADNASLVKQRQTAFYYDGQGIGNILGRGNLTKTESYYDDAPGAFSIVTRGYDSYGNLTWIKDANANDGRGVNQYLHTVDYSYDPTYRTFPLSTTDANDFTTTTHYDEWMRPDQVVDVNGIPTTTYYDYFGRVQAVRKYGDNAPGAPTLAKSYNDVPDLGAGRPVYVKTITKDGTSDGLISYTFVDGLGRPIQTKSEGVGTNEWYSVDTYFNNKGKVDRTSVTYKTTTTDERYVSRKGTGEQGVWTAYDYDPIGRVIATIKPDGTATTYEYHREATSNDGSGDPDFNWGGRATAHTVDAVGHRVRRSFCSRSRSLTDGERFFLARHGGQVAY